MTGSDRTGPFDLPPIIPGGDAARAPVPTGPIAGPRTPLRRFASRLAAWVNTGLGFLPPGRWLHRRLQRGMEFTSLQIPLARGGTGLEGLQVAFLTDIHAGSYMDARDILRIFQAVAAEEPDLVCLGGDLINTRDREILHFREALAVLHPPLGVYAVPGNHDHFFGRDITLWEMFLRDQGVHVLVNRGRRVFSGGDSLWVAGVDDLTEGRPSLGEALAGRWDAEPVLLLTHHPDFFFEAAAAGVDLTLAGHTHGGQISFCTRILGHTHFGYWSGGFQENGARLYVSRGVGVTFLPVRWGAPPEVPMIRFTLAGREGEA